MFLSKESIASAQVEYQERGISMPVGIRMLTIRKAKCRNGSWWWPLGLYMVKGNGKWSG